MPLVPPAQVRAVRKEVCSKLQGLGVGVWGGVRVRGPRKE